MTVQTAAGATLRVTATAPGTFDDTGYTALFAASPVPKLVGEITDLGDFGRVYNAVKHQPVASRGVQKFKGSYDEGQMTLKIGVDQDDTGQVVMNTALNSDANYYFQVKLQNGDCYSFAAKVLSWKINVGGVDSVVSATAQLELTTTSAGVGIVAHNAP